jgi:hypothetical protein
MKTKTPSYHRHRFPSEIISHARMVKQLIQPGGI